MLPALAYGAIALVSGIGAFGFLKPLRMKFRNGDKVIANNAFAKPFSPSTGNALVLKAMQDVNVAKLPGLLTLKNTSRLDDKNIVGTAFFADNFTESRLPLISAPDFATVDEAGQIMKDGFIRVVIPNESIAKLFRGLDEHEVKWSMFERVS